MDMKMMKCASCGHEEMGEMGAKCSTCGGDMKPMDDAAGAGDAQGDAAMPSADAAMDGGMGASDSAQPAGQDMGGQQ